MSPSPRIPALAALVLFLAASTLFAQEANPRSNALSPKLDRYGDPLPKGAIDRLGSPRLRPSHAYAFRFSPDRRTLFTIGQYGTLIAWDVDSGKKIRTFGKTKGSWLTVSPDGKLLATWQPRMPVDFWDAVRGAKIRTWNGRFTGFAAGDTLLPSGELRIRDISDAPKNEKAKVGPTNEGGLRSEYSSPDGTHRFIVDIARPSIEIWDIPKNERIALMKSDRARHEDHLSCTDFTPDGKIHISAWATGIRIFSLAENRELPLLTVPESQAFSIAPDGKRLAAATRDGSLALFDIESAREIRRWKADFRLGCLGFSPDGAILASTSGCAIRFWNPETGERVDSFGDFDDPIKSIRFSPDGTTFAVDCDRRLEIVDASSFRMVASIPREIAFRYGLAPIYGPDGRSIAFIDLETEGSSDFRVRIADTATGKNRVAYEKGDESLRIGLGRSGLRIFRPSNEGYVVVDAAAGKEIFRHRWPEFGSRSQPLESLVVSPDGRLVADAFDPQQMQLIVRDAASATVVRRLALPKELKLVDGSRKFEDNRAVLIGFSDDCRSFQAAITEPDLKRHPVEIGTLELFQWETATGLLRGRWKAEPNAFDAYAFSGNGRILATATGNSIRAVDPATGEELARFVGHDTDIIALSLSPDGRKLVSGGADGTVTLWDLSSAFAPSSAKLGDERLRELWKTLEGADGQAAYRAIGTLSSHPNEAVPFLRPLLPHGPAADSKLVEGLVAQLEHDDFAVREKASASLAQLGHAATPLLRSAASSATSAETRGRLRALLARLENGANGSDGIRMLRAIEVLERIASPGARAVLREVRDFGVRSIAEAVSEFAIAEPVSRLPNRP